jgi:hypothetical protein
VLDSLSNVQETARAIMTIYYINLFLSQHDRLAKNCKSKISTPKSTPRKSGIGKSNAIANLKPETREQSPVHLSQIRGLHGVRITRRLPRVFHLLLLHHLINLLFPTRSPTPGPKAQAEPKLFGDFGKSSLNLRAQPEKGSPS